MRISVTVILTTYNRPDALGIVLEAYLSQRNRDFELIVADDGSTKETGDLVKNFTRRADFKIEHVWHDDLGFRAGAIRNRAIHSASSDYLIFSDGDCIPMPDFVEQHRKNAERGWFLVGNRVLVNNTLSTQIVSKETTLPDDKLGLAKRRIRGEINRLLPLWRIPIPGFSRKIYKRSWKGAMTCNLSAWKQDLIDINGFDESYSGWGLEDSDLVIRLLRRGLKRKSLRFSAPVFHLWHRENDRSSLEKNKALLDRILNSSEFRAVKGLTS